MRRRWVAWLVVGLGAQIGAEEMRVGSVAVPARVTVGDRFEVRLRVAAPPGSRIRFPTRPPASPHLQPLGGARVHSLPGARAEALAVYPMVAWRPGPQPALALLVRVDLPGGAIRRLRVPLRLPEVLSVLPRDTAVPAPRPAKDVIGRRWDTWWWAAAAVGVALVAAGLVARRRRRPAPSPPPPASADAVERALAALERARADLLASGNVPGFYDAGSGAVRALLSTRSARWGSELTTGELLARMTADGVSPERATGLRLLLDEADRVKFAAALPPVSEADRFAERAAAWVRGAP